MRLIALMSVASSSRRMLDLSDAPPIVDGYLDLNDVQKSLDKLINDLI